MPASGRRSCSQRRCSLPRIPNMQNARCALTSSPTTTSRCNGSKAHSTATELSLTIGVRLNSVARSEEHTSELQSLMRISYAVFCLKKKKNNKKIKQYKITTSHNTLYY